MKSNDWNEALLAEHRNHITDDGARGAFDALVAKAIEIPTYQCAPGMQGEARIFTYNDPTSKERPFAFIVNRKSTLFYVRKAGLQRVRSGLDSLRTAFPEATENALGEWTVRISVREDAERISALLFGVAPKSRGIPNGITRDDVLSAIARIDTGVDHRFGPSLKYDLVVEGRRYAPKAVIGLAAERLAGRVLAPADFSGGNDSKSTKILRDLGFVVAQKAADSNKRWRTDPKLAGEMLLSILATLSPEARNGVIDMLKGALTFANANFENRWLLTLHPNYVRFIAGMVLNLQFRSTGQATVLLERNKAPVGFRENGDAYLNAPGCVEIAIESTDLVAQYAALRSANESAMVICAQTRAISAGHRQAHSPGLAQYLQELGVEGNHRGHAPATDYPNEIEPNAKYIEGARKQVLVNAYERDAEGRAACIAHHGCQCVICGFDFEERYGPLGSGFIHVHHLKPMSLTDGRYELDPIADLRPVCPNCHAMLHRENKLLTIEELRSILSSHAGS